MGRTASDRIHRKRCCRVHRFDHMMGIVDLICHRIFYRTWLFHDYQTGTLDILFLCPPLLVKQFD